ncbi:hypothetical protein MSAN_02353600 [Mycena sanguinolenta]|uniref:Uncharacterized protein n=1 Tax=Mycena sanguinolenta TaxID=230812 RepID=A0A8H7CH38_9AGAR|nr:hypothetical protein MSAN_02353600 [Mycena sanguinolenta]
MDNALSISIILGAISLIPYNRYILWSLGSASLALYAADRQRPSNKLGQLEASIDSVGETLKLAKASCMRNHVELMDVTIEFHEIKFSVSTIKYRLLETRTVSTWSTLKDYVWNTKEIWKSINRCGKKVKQIGNSIERIREAEHQREFSQEIQASREIISSLMHRASKVNRHVRSATGSYESIV